MNKLKYWILGILTTVGFTALTAYAATWYLPPTIKQGDLIVATSTTQTVRLASGTVGSVLSMKNNVPTWVATSTLGFTGGTASPLTTKGDIYTFDTANQRLAVGSNGQCLIASSTQPTGLVWGACASGSTGITTLNGLTGATQTFATGTPPTGLDLFITSAGSTHTFVNALQAGYNIPLSASTTNWNNLYNNVLSRLTVATGTSGTIFNISTSTNSVIINLPLSSASNTGQLQAGDFLTFNNKLSGNLTNGYVVRATGASTTATGILIDNGTVAGVNATSSTVNFNVQGTGSNSPFNVASSTGTSMFKVGADGTLTLTTANALFTSSGAGITFENTGDTYGTVRLSLQNRNGVNGALFENASNGSAKGLVDFVFKPDYNTATSQRNIRLENRSGLTFSALPEFQIGSSSNPALVISDLITNVRTGNFGVGTDTPAANLAVNGTFAATGITYLNKIPYTWPSSQASGVKILSNDGAGNLSWATDQTGSGSATTTISGVAGPTFTIATGTTGNIFNVATSTGTVTFNLPFSSSINTGQLQGSDWLNFNNKLSGSLTSGQVVYASGASSTAGSSLFTFAPATGLNVSSTSTLATTTINGTLTVNSITNCNSTQFLQITSGLFGCGTPAGGSGTVSGGSTGFVTTWASSTGLTFGTLRDNGTVSGVNATSSSYSFNIQGTGSLSPFNVASSSGTSLFNITPTGNINLGSSAAIINGLSATAGNTAGGSINLTSGNGFGSGTGGDVVLTGGVGGATANGGFARMIGGNGGSTSGNGGGLTMSAGNASNGNGNGGSVFIFPGNKNGSGSNGNIWIYPSNNAVFGGMLDFSAIASSDKTFTFPNNSGVLTLGTGTNGQVPYFSNTNTVTSTPALLSNGTVVGVNATSSSTSFLIQAGANQYPFYVASSTGSMYLQVAPNGSTTLSSLGTGNVCTSGGSFYNCTVSGSLSGGINGYLTRWLSGTTVGTGASIDNGTVAGVNATSSTVSFNVQGTAALNPFNVASSTGTSLLTVLANGNTGIGLNTPQKPFHVYGSTANGVALFERQATGNVGSFVTFIVQADSNGSSANGFGPMIDFYQSSNSSTTLGSNIASILAVKDNGSNNTGNFQIMVQNAGTPKTIASFNWNQTVGINSLATSSVLTVASSTGTSYFNVGLSGLVGIGSTSPNSLLTVQGTAAQTVDLFSVASSSGASAFRILNTGDALFKSAVNSATALQVQNSSGQAVLTVDTTSIVGTPSSYPLTVASSTGASLVGWNGYGNQIMLGNGMVYSSSTAPSIATSTGAGSASGSASITGGNMAGEVTLNAGTSPAANAVLFTITPTNNNPANKLICTFTPSNINAASTTANSTLVFASSTASQIALVSGTSGLTASVTYKWMYHCGGY